MSANDMKAANRTYEGFIAGIKWSVPILIVITAAIVVAIAS